MATFKIDLYCSNHNHIGQISVDNVVNRPDQYARQYHGGKGTFVKMKSYSERQIKSILEANGHHTNFKIFRTQDKRRDGILINMPWKIQLITEVPDDRPLPAQESMIGHELNDLLRGIDLLYRDL